MTPEQYASLTAGPTSKAVVGVDDLVDKSPRTLIYGYTLDRATFHAYLGTDGLIHVMTYNDGFAPEGSDVVPFLVQHHSAGPCGGLDDNEYYVPRKRVYPALSDFEFCTLLQRYGVQPCFTTFEADDTRGPFAGRTFDEPGATIMADVSSDLMSHVAFRGGDYAARRDLAYRVAYQTARDMKLALTSDGGVVCVPLEAVESFKVEALAMIATLPKYVPSADGGIADGLVEHIYGKGKLAGNFNVTTESTFGGELHFEVSVQDVQAIRARSKNFALYTSGVNSGWARGVSGVFKGRPFLVCQNDHGWLSIRLSQFGGTDRFLAQGLRLYGLHPAAASAPQTAEA